MHDLNTGKTKYMSRTTYKKFRYPSSSRDYPQRELYPGEIDKYGPPRDSFDYRRESRYEADYMRDYRRDDARQVPYRGEARQMPPDWEPGADHREARDMREPMYRGSERDYSREPPGRPRPEPGYEEKLTNGSYGAPKPSTAPRPDYSRQISEHADSQWGGPSIDSQYAQQQQQQATSTSQMMSEQQTGSIDERYS